ncbi:MAG: S41 family peptidase [Patescibacteria group bacterium]
MPRTSQRIALIITIIIALVAAFWTGVEWSRSHSSFLFSTSTSSGSSTVSTEIEKLENVDFSPLWQTWEIINARFVDSSNNSTSSSSAATSSKVITNQDKVYGAAQGLVRALGDPYSEFLPPADKKQFDEEIQGHFGGIGIELGVRDGALSVIAPLPGTPAAKAGIKVGDKIVKIAGQTSAELSISRAIDLIRGEVGTVVDLSILRPGEPELLEFKLKRAVINVPTIETKTLPNSDIFVITLYNFGGTSADLFRNALREFVAGKTDKLIIDLRGNPGGYLDAAVDMASWFLPLGKTIAIEDRGRGEEAKLYQSSGYNIFNNNLKLVILVDSGSASASEILAGALRDHGRATLIGEKTFGKGSVQELIPITSETSLKLTIAKWLTPKGVSISHNGLEPDITLKIPEKVTDSEEIDALMLARAEKFLLTGK